MIDPRYIDFSREDWAALRGRTPLTLTETEVEKLRGISVALDIEMVEETFLPISRLLNLHVQSSQLLASVTDTFLAAQPVPKPFVIGVAGSVAVGKSTIARVLQALLARWPHHPQVELVTTDGFLYPNAILQERGLMARKGFPETYNRAALLDFVARAKAGEDDLEIPIYSHLGYDIVEGEVRVVSQPDILIVEGLNVLQAGARGPFVSDYFDFSIFVDAEVADIMRWYTERFLAPQEDGLHQPGLLLSPVCRSNRRRGFRNGPVDLARDQPTKLD